MNAGINQGNISAELAKTRPPDSERSNKFRPENPFIRRVPHRGRRSGPDCRISEPQEIICRTALPLGLPFHGSRDERDSRFSTRPG